MDDDQIGTVPGPAHRALVVDDAAENRSLAAAMLRRLGLTVDEATDGCDALAKLADTPYSMILMDVHMPVLDGLAATRELRASQSWETRHDVPVVAITADARPEAHANCFAAGMSSYLAKPFGLEALRREVSRWLTDAQAEPGADEM